MPGKVKSLTARESAASRVGQKHSYRLDGGPFMEVDGCYRFGVRLMRRKYGHEGSWRRCYATVIARNAMAANKAYKC